MSHPIAYRNVLVPIDLSARSTHALAHAAALVAPRGTIHLVHVLELPESPNPMYAHYGQRTPTPDEKRKLLAEVGAALEKATAGFEAPPGVNVKRHVLEQAGDHVVDRICKAGEELSADVLCIASHGRGGLARALLGSVADGLVRRSRAPILVIRVPDHELEQQ